MLVTFTCNAYADITMFGDAAKRLLTMMGHSGTVPGAIMAEDVPAALDRLKSAIEAEQALPTPDLSMEVQSDESNQLAVSLKHRAFSLIELLTAAAKEKCDVMWK